MKIIGGVLFFVGFILIGIVYMLRIMHWPGQTLIAIIAMILSVVGILLYIFSKKISLHNKLIFQF